jgi:hypothetical protein
MPEVTIYAENVVIPALGPGILIKGGRLEYRLEYLVQHLFVFMPMLVQPHGRNIAVLDRNRQESDHYDAVW